MNLGSWGRQWRTEPVYSMAREAMTSLSLTEQQAIEAGDGWWDAQLFSGRPDWRALLEVPPVALSEDEQAFIDGPVAQLCHMLNDWEITWHDADLPAQAWDFIRQQGFFGMIIPKERSEEQTSELQSLMRISYAVFCLKKIINNKST